MNRSRIYLLIFLFVFSIRSIAQTYSYQVIDDGCHIDTVKMLKWPATVPSSFQNLLCFDEVRKMRVHSREINIELPNQIVKTDQFTQRHHNVGVYFTNDRSGFKIATLHEFGLGTLDFISNPKSDGYYLVLSENNGRRRSTIRLSKLRSSGCAKCTSSEGTLTSVSRAGELMRRGDLIMYQAKSCEGTKGSDIVRI